MEDLTQENETKLKLFKLAVEGGELDHLIYKDMQPVMRLQKQFYRVVDNALRFNSIGDTELQKYQSVIGMVYTLIEERRVSELFDVKQKHFPEYYSF